MREIIDYRIVTNKSSSELGTKVLDLMKEGWSPVGSHQAVTTESYEQYAGNQHRATKYTIVYSQTVILYAE
jgi:mannose-1-phosphate guanylyltransferase